MAKLYILGAGGMGTAMAVAMSNVGHEVWLWGWNKEENDRIRQAREHVQLLKGVKIPESVCIVDTVDGVESADAVIIATPTVGVRGAAKQLAGKLSNDIPVACTSKGLEPKTLLPLHEVVAQELPENSFVALSGPSHAEEISQGIPTVLVAASKSLAAAQKIQDLTVQTHIRIYTSDDVVGVELGGALKNVIAFAAGVVDGMGGGDNTKAALMTRGLTEIARMGVKMGAKRETFAGLSGVGDLIVTCCSMHSRNRRCGLYVGEGCTVDEAVEKVGMTVEGITAAICAYELSQKLGVDMPITSQIYSLIKGQTTAKQAVEALLARPPRHEVDYNWLEEGASML
ncbi:NAD(P)H-dependent glycerol-3-phosphate dehydrogenase [Oscillospiraceae bacterium LTW-04]|nr:NAD(P)H-dependent glycerol-3-phosphate dehydrogenase [Oscillospiraceae bacterium MB24-C1]